MSGLPFAAQTLETTLVKQQPLCHSWSSQGWPHPRVPDWEIYDPLYWQASQGLARHYGARSGKLLFLFQSWIPRVHQGLAC